VGGTACRRRVRGRNPRALGAVLPVVNTVVVVSHVVAVSAALALIAHVARRYGAAPARLPTNLGLDGRPSSRTVGKWFLWLPPAIITWVLVMLSLPGAPPESHRGSPLADALTYLTIAYTALLMAWVLDRQIAVARDPAVRFAPAGLLTVVLPLLVLVAAAVAVETRA
jgi:hypothetical protein